MVADGAAGQVTCQVFDNMLGLAVDRRRRLDVSNPSFRFELIDESPPVVIVLQVSVFTGQIQLTADACSLESTEAGLEVGTRTQVDVLNAQRNLFQAEVDAAGRDTASRDAALSLALEEVLLRLTGSADNLAHFVTASRADPTAPLQRVSVYQSV